MFRNYLSAACRSARHDRFYALLNVLGLGLGFAMVILIGLFVRDELSFNRFLPGYQDAYWARLTIADPGQVRRVGTTRPTPLPLLVGAKHSTCSGPSWRR